ncbi:MAG: carbamoyl phosphate synthase small subunit [Oscillospiraceae bacterium]|jgi:carbamoyl-phosphate synthase small subunit|nr:carbamoyl phosphate synthase small subunit [Oscillospiraceae bacterium]
MNKRAWLTLEDGTVFEGESFGAEGGITGEVVFTTSMTGFQETLTDPNYSGQIVVSTFPIAGCPGANSEDNLSDYGGAAGLIVREQSVIASNFRCEETINEFMKERGIVGLYGIDTRKLTRILRKKGTMNGIISTTENADISDLKSFTPEITLISGTEAVTHKIENAKYNIALIDYGHRKSIISLFGKLNCSVTVIPFSETVNPADFDGVVLSDGAGNPAECIEEIEAVKALAAAKIPLFGIGLGHQLLALASGGKTAKHLHGHRGANIPVIDLESGRTYITAQNHGYFVSDLPVAEGVITHVNANDRTCEAIRYSNIPALSVQFVPSDMSGVNATVYLAERFLGLMGK